MPITFAGIGLTPPDGSSAALEWWHGHRVEEFDYPFFNSSGLDHLPVPSEPYREPPRIGVLCWPTGASRWAKIHLFVSGEQLALVRAAVGVAPTARPLVLDDGLRTVTASMWMLPPRPILQKGVGELYLLTLVDDRYFWWQAGNVSVTNTASWSGLLSGLFASLGVSATIDAVPSGYGTPTADRWTVGYKPAPFLIDAACKTVGLRVVRQLDGTVRCQSYATASAQDALNWTVYQYQVLAGGRLAASDVALSVPASVSTAFLGQAPVVLNTTLAALALPEYGAAAGATGKSAQVIADTPATAPTVSQALYAVQAATDYYSWALSLTDCTLRGFWDRPVTGLDDYQEWVDAPDRMLTRVIRTVYSDRNVYGDTSIPSGWVPGIGSGSEQDCSDALEPVTFSCSSGVRKATVKTLVVGIEDGKLVVNECGQNEYDLGPCSPDNPAGTTVPVAIKVCPVYTTLNYLDHASQPQTLEVVTGIIVERRSITVPVADEETGCIESTDCCGLGSGSGVDCFGGCFLCATMSSVWTLTIDGEPVIALEVVSEPDDGNYCRLRSDDLTWDLRYEESVDMWVLTNLDDGRVWWIDASLWSCSSANTLAPVDAGQSAAVLEPAFTCSGTGSGGGTGCVDGQSIRTMTFSNKTGDCTCLPATGTYGGPGPPPYIGTWTTASCPGNVGYALQCVDGEYILEVNGGFLPNGTFVSLQVTPFELVFDLPDLGANCGGSGGSARVTFTE